MLPCSLFGWQTPILVTIHLGKVEDSNQVGGR